MSSSTNYPFDIEDESDEIEYSKNFGNNEILLQNDCKNNANLGCTSASGLESGESWVKNIVHFQESQIRSPDACYTIPESIWVMNNPEFSRSTSLIRDYFRQVYHFAKK